ncbi:MAG: mycofactocin biosynthesis peptidyl-dipeptidase MftE [Acidimicrobiaceae bacterium]|jgi:mycofactocin system creatininase family protein|nr:mycofactocin biosynthesis peptidyl-dipeptidase MftE [Acidimicrobiaceae bacterium]MBP6488024.1 mycofactocin biosynthesis peptidyl-dipeptidase MftE [Ilumatobacteraceae bacterium]MBP7890172.1 mycofactocin biosynthesis peptidyl-dipeptidase MftE [Ilumatobacteraceae bacterium]HRC46782.1 mycofactocin biosynthesis peptidyl-dipeptidase MftE [Ilumatobacteraceae bacterium]
MTKHLGRTTWSDHWKPTRRPLLVVPIGACEQHGPHLPLDTDTRIAVALAQSLADKYDEGDLLVTPALGITASGEHASFPGTLSIGAAVMEQVIIELVRSADWSAGVVLVNGHGGNRVAVEQAVRVLHAEQRRVLAWWPNIPGGDAHAGDTETSMMLALAPDLVRMHRAEVGNTEPLANLLDEMLEGGVRAVSANGVLGDPRHASATHGRNTLTRLNIDLVAAVDEWWE